MRFAVLTVIVLLFACQLVVGTAIAADTLVTTVTTSGTPARLTLEVDLTVADADAGQSGSLFLVALLQDGTPYQNVSGQWQAYAGMLLPYSQTTLGTHSISILSGNDVTPLVGTSFYMGYGKTAEDMIQNAKYAKVYTIPGSVSGPATAADWLTFSINVQDFSYPDNSADTVARIIDLHEQYKVPVDIYLTDVMLDSYQNQYPELMVRLRTSAYVNIAYHIRPPKPYYTGYDWAGLDSMSADAQKSLIRNYETHLTDGVTGQPTETSGGLARLKTLIGDNPLIAAFQADAALYDSVATVFKELGATMTISHTGTVNLGDTSKGLYIRPEHYDLKLFSYPGQSAQSLIDSGFTAIREISGARAPFVVGVKMHDNDFFASASAWTTVYINGSRKPNWDTSKKAVLKSEADAVAQWTLYEQAVSYAATNKSRIGAMNSTGMAGILSAATANPPKLYISGTMHIESAVNNWPNIDQLLVFFQRATAAGQVGSQTTGMRWSLGADVGWLNGEVRAGEAIRALAALGVSFDIHAHNSADRALAAEKIVALGATPNTVISGIIYTEIDGERTAHTTSTGYSWQGDTMWGIVLSDGHTVSSDDTSGGLWRPRSSNDWQTHDPAGNLVAVGGCARNIESAENIANAVAAGGYTAPVYSCTLNVQPKTLLIVDTTDGIDAIESFASRVGANNSVRWATIGETAAAWKAAGEIPSKINDAQ